MTTNQNPYYDALKAIVNDLGVIDGHHDLHHDGNDWAGDTLINALEVIRAYTPGLSDEDQRELAAMYAEGYGEARGEKALSRG